MVISKWWNGLSDGAQGCVLLGGPLTLFVVSMTLGVLGAVLMGAWEPMMHIGFSLGIVGVLGAIFTAMARY